MLKVDLDVKRNRCMIAVAGTGMDILADVGFLIGKIHKSMDSDNAKEFKYLIQKCIADEESPVWEREEKLENEPDGVKGIRFVFPGKQE